MSLLPREPGAQSGPRRTDDAGRVCWWRGALFGGSPVTALASAALLSVTVGLAVYVSQMRRMTGQPVISGVLVTIALGIFLRGMIVLTWTVSRLSTPSINFSGAIRRRAAAGAAISTVAMVTIAMARYGTVHLRLNSRAGGFASGR